MRWMRLPPARIALTRWSKSAHKKPRGPEGPREYDSPKVVSAYFFFAVFLLLFLEDLAAAFLVAISLTTFHAVRDLPVAPTWQKVLDRSSKLDCDVLGDTSETGMPTTFNSDLTLRARDLVSGDHHFDCRKYAIDKSYCQAFVYRNRNEDELFHAVPHAGQRVAARGERRAMPENQHAKAERRREMAAPTRDQAMT